MTKLQKSNLILDPPEEHQIKGRKFTSVKNEIFTKVYIPKDIRPNSVLGRVAYHAVSLADSQLFLGVDIKKTENEYVIAEHNFNYLPFYDFMTLVDFKYHEEDWMIQEGLLLRIRRIKEETRDDVLVYAFIKGSDLRYRLSMIVKCDRKMRDRPKTLFDISPFAEFTVYEMLTIAMRITHCITCYPKRVRTTQPHRNPNVTLPEDIRYTQGTLKLKRTLPKDEDESRVNQYPSIRKSPIEHMRMGYWATRKKSGVRYWVKPQIINEGKGGRAEHDYKLGA